MPHKKPRVRTDAQFMAAADKAFRHTVMVTVGHNFRHSVSALLGTLGTLYPGEYTDGSTTWTFPLNTALRPEEVQAKVWEKFIGIWCHVE